ncbi:MAG: hypothetical protein MZU97_17280 [Bacillus subtilis]|nr:hypothetical protein [Bacillus subtilis]
MLRTQKIEFDGDPTDYLEKVVYSYETGTNKLNQMHYYTDYDQNNDTNIDNTANYEYDNYDRLKTGYVTNGEKIEYTYINEINDKVMIVESFYDSSKYSEINYDYYFRETIISDHTDNFVIYKFDDYGHTTNIIDKNTNTVYYKYIDIFNNIDTYVNESITTTATMKCSTNPCLKN